MKTVYVTPWGEVPVVEATIPLDLIVRRKHIKAGTPGNAYSCALAKAAEEQVGARIARVERTRAYLLYDDKAVRYYLGRKARDSVMQFDMSGGLFAPTGVVTLGPAPRNRTLDGMNEARARRKSGIYRPRPGRGHYSKRADPLVALGVRSGTGGKHIKHITEPGDPTP